MSKEVKTPWYKRVYGFFERGVTGSFGSFLKALFAIYCVFFLVVLIYSLISPKNIAETIESTTTYSESSTVVPVYTPPPTKRVAMVSRKLLLI